MFIPKVHIEKNKNPRNQKKKYFKYVLLKTLGFSSNLNEIFLPKDVRRIKLISDITDGNLLEIIYTAASSTVNKFLINIRGD